MDPVIAWQELEEQVASGMYYEAACTALDLRDWLLSGGFPPRLPSHELSWENELDKVIVDGLRNRAQWGSRPLPEGLWAAAKHWEERSF